MPRYFLDLPGESEPRPWDPHQGPHPERADTRYFGTAFVVMEPLLRDPGLDVYLTWDWRRLPAYGERVVAVLLGDEVGRIPPYVDRVRAVFKCYGTRPTRTTGGLAQYAIRWLRWLPTGATYALLRARGRPTAPVVTIPLGTYNQVDLPVVPIEQRPVDLFFAGSVEHGPGLRHRLRSPKARTRRAMLQAVERLQATRPELRADMRVTPSFDASVARSAAENSQGLMDAKVCLAPRGTSVETWRLFEGLRAGCVVIGDRLPPHPFYAGAPVLQLDRWDQLERMLEPVLDGSGELQRMHLESLAWWRDHCSEQALGRFLAQRLNELSQAR
jgi:hypothetical protein